MTDMREILAEGISDAECEEYIEYSSKLRRVESADLLFGELLEHQQAIENIGKWLQAGVEGADLMSEMLADHRRKRDLCQREINRRDRAGAYPPGGAVVLDFSNSKLAIKGQTIQVIESYGIQLQKRGKEYFGLCPFHNDHHPSFRVNAEKHFWYCDVCGFGGDIFDFISRIEHLTNAK